jgi:hypothetical protein
MHNAFSAVLGLIVPVCIAATISNAVAAPPAKQADDRYIAARDAAIEKISAIYDAGNANDAARKAEEAASTDLAAQMRAILNEAARAGFGPAKLHIDTFNKGDEYKRCFTLNAPKQPSFAEATRQAQRLLSAALNTR